MGNFKVYIHGRPQGQDIWPQYETTNDRIYIEPFLDSNIGGDVNVSLITDIYQNNSYFTYIHRKNVVEKVARGQVGNSYFALTIRFNESICRNVNSLYNLLNQVYEQMCVGSIIKNENGIKHFMVNRFEENQAVAGQIVSIIEQNIEKVLSPSIVGLGKARDTNTSRPIEYALSDVDSPSFIEDVTKFKLIISPEKESKSEKYSSLLQRVQPIKEKCDNLAFELNKTQQTANSLKDSNEALQRSIQTIEEEKRQLEIKLTNATSTVAAQYKKQIEAKDVEIRKITLESQKQTDALGKAQKRIAELEKEVQSIGQNKDVINSFEQIKEPLITFARQVASRFPQGNKVPNTVVSQGSQKGVSYDKIKDWLSVGTFVLLIGVFGLTIYNSLHNTYSGDDIDISSLNHKLDSLQKANEALKDKIGNYDYVKDAPQEDTQSKEVDAKLNVSIDIGGYSGKGNLIQGQTYTLSVKNAPGQGAFEVNGKLITGNSFTVGGDSEIKISFIYGGNPVVTRVLKTQKASTSRQKKVDDKKDQNEEKVINNHETE